MNERIKKLKDQCWEERRWNNDMWIEKHIDLEKFAELIVKECSNVCSDVGVAIFAATTAAVPRIIMFVSL